MPRHYVGYEQGHRIALSWGDLPHSWCFCVFMHFSYEMKSESTPGVKVFEHTTARVLSYKRRVNASVRDVGGSVGTLLLSPNPACDLIRVVAPQAIVRTCVYTSSGALVLTLPVDGTSADIHVGDLECGVYAVRALGVNGNAMNGSFLKTK